MAALPANFTVRVNRPGMVDFYIACAQRGRHFEHINMLLPKVEINMGDQQALGCIEVSNSERRTAQLVTLCHFLDVFASANSVVRAGAAHYGETLREDGYDVDEVVKIAATALLVAIEYEIDQKALALTQLPSIWSQQS